MEGEEPGNPVDEGKPEPDQRSVFDRLSLKNLGRMGLVAVLGVTAAFGGLDRVVPEKTVTLGQAYDNGPVQLTLTRVYRACTTEQVPKSAQWDVKNALGKSLPVIELDLEAYNTSKDLVDYEHSYSFDHSYRPTLNIFELQDPPSNSYLGWFQTDGSSAGTYSLPAGKRANLRAVWIIPQRLSTPNFSITLRVNDIERFQNNEFLQMQWRLTGTFGTLRADLPGCPS